MKRDPDPGARMPLRRLGELVFGTDTRQRRLLTLLMLTAFVYSVGLGVMAYGAHTGIVAPTPMYIMAALIVLSTSVFYVLIRSGLNKRWDEPTLAFPQALSAQSMVAAAYTGLSNRRQILDLLAQHAMRHARGGPAF